jgi:predicted N-acetyltransferase YhbS
MDYLVRLYDLPEVKPEIDRLLAESIIIRRALPPEKHLVTEWIEANFNGAWASECEVAFSHQPVSCFIATKSRAVIGFCCYDATCKGFLGPAGVERSYRKRGIGRTLMARSLHGMAETGHAYAILGAGRPNYYEKKFGAIPIPGSTPGIYRDLLKNI